MKLLDIVSATALVACVRLCLRLCVSLCLVCLFPVDYLQEGTRP